MVSKKILKRSESWGELRYNIDDHHFTFSESLPVKCGPYSGKPALLNIVISRKCNLSCRHCVARDFDGIVNADLVLTSRLISTLKESPFLVMVLTGGEPLLEGAQGSTTLLIKELKNKGMIIDTNGSIMPNAELLRLLKTRRVMVRVSLDSMNPSEEFDLRRIGKDPSFKDEKLYFQKLKHVNSLKEEGVSVAIQTVVWNKRHLPENRNNSLLQMIDWLSKNEIRDWYLQRLIPSHKCKEKKDYWMSSDDYRRTVNFITDKAAKVGINCHSKFDLRHNSVFLLLGEGELYTQGEAPGQKIPLGSIFERREDYFSRVSSADHARRYFLTKNLSTGE